MTEQTIKTGNISVTFTRETVLSEAVNRAMLAKAGAIYKSLAAEHGVPDEAMDIALSKYIDIAAQVKQSEGFTFYKVGQSENTLKQRFDEYAALPPRVIREWQRAIYALDESWNEYALTPDPVGLDTEKK